MRQKKANFSEAQLDDVFHALSDRTRRKMLQMMAAGSCGVGDFTEQFTITPPAISRHLRVLERSGLIRRTVTGRNHRISLRPNALLGIDQWLRQYSSFWESNLDSLEDYVNKKKNSKNPSRPG